MVNQNGSEVSFNDVRSSHISYSKEEIQMAVDKPDYGSLGKGHCVRSFLQTKQDWFETGFKSVCCVFQPANACLRIRLNGRK